MKELHFCGVTQIFTRLAAFTYDVYHVTRSKEFYNTALLIQTGRNRKNCYFDWLFVSLCFFFPLGDSEDYLCLAKSSCTDLCIYSLFIYSFLYFL